LIFNLYQKKVVCGEELASDNEFTSGGEIKGQKDIRSGVSKVRNLSAWSMRESEQDWKTSRFQWSKKFVL
jgi:hypothetical protein